MRQAVDAALQRKGWLDAHVAAIRGDRALVGDDGPRLDPHVLEAIDARNAVAEPQVQPGRLVEAGVGPLVVDEANRAAQDGAVAPGRERDVVDAAGAVVAGAEMLHA